MIFPPSEPDRSSPKPRLPVLSVRVMIGAAAAFALLITGIAYLLQRGNTPDATTLLDALDAFNGEWQGEALIEPSDGGLPFSSRVTRRYSWVGGKQVVETRLVHGGQEYAIRMMQWIEGGELKAVLMGPAGESTTFIGAPTADGILWKNQDRPQADSLDRIVVRDGRTCVHSAGFATLRLGDISGSAWVAAVMELPGATSPVYNRVAQIESRLPTATSERGAPRAIREDAERTPLAHTQAAAATPRPKAMLSTVPESGENQPAGSRLEIKSASPGMSFVLRAAGENADARVSHESSGTTPATLEALPAGEYTVIVRSPGTPETTHTVVMHDNMDVNLFLRGAELPITQTPLPALSPSPTAARLVRASEIDEPPSPVLTVLPRLRDLSPVPGFRINVSMLIDERGVPHDPEMAGGLDEHLRKLCLEAASRWRFHPARAGGQAVSVRVTVPITVR